MDTVKSLSIGDVHLSSRYILAPMAGISNLPFRLLCAQKGAGLVCMEMVSAKAIFYQNKKTLHMLEVHKDEHPVSLQLFGSSPEVISDMAEQIEALPIDIIDLNMGCPAPKVVKNGDGSALLKNPILAGKIIENTVKKTKKPVTVKIRLGVDKEHINAVEVAKIAEASGAKAITVHGRTASQFYAGCANWDMIAEVKASVGIPVIANGDIKTPEDAKRCFLTTGCDGIMVARGARGNPWIFEEFLHYEKTGERLAPPALSEVTEMIRSHAKLMIEYKGELIAMQEMRKHAAWYLAGYRGALQARRKLNSIRTMEELSDLLAFLEEDSQEI